MIEGGGGHGRVREGGRKGEEAPIPRVAENIE